MIVCVVLLLIGGVLLFPFPLTALGHVSVVPNLFGGVSLRLFKKSFFAARMKINGHELTFTPASGKTKSVDLTPSKSAPNSLVSHLDNGIFKVMDVRSLQVFAVAGVADDAMSTALTLTAMRVAFGMTAGVLKSRYAGLKFFDSYDPAFNEDKLTVTFKLSVAVSLLDMIYAIIYAAAKKLRKRRNYVAKHQHA